ncbi:HAS-barrel domain-containing protein [Roseofilum sp. Guam]|uniref:HAS-barrel domain-containing protein n=1 Tax=Roseofilum sp. Guam TaxID=2821502 RepID=UPI001AFEDB50|nr:HAS-barrel domain-containing protein [Roseofilum sp. Guam]MBP0027442.1 hypothetical protein [Roseofilum sp. Guam]
MRLPLTQTAINDRPENHIAEVIETATSEFLAQCLEPEDLNFPMMPAFGSFVRSLGVTPERSAEPDTGYWVYAVVYHATTTPIDSIHRARALGLSLEQLRAEQPQIFAMLKTEFRAAIVGFETLESAISRSRVYQHLPPRPPQIHQAVYQCHPDEVIRFSEDFDFIRILLEIPGTPVDALIAATLRTIYQLRHTEHSWLVQAGRNLSLLLKDDYDRLRYILSQVYL